MLDLSTEEMNHQPEKFRNLKPNNTSSKSYKKLLEFKLKPCCIGSIINLQFFRLKKNLFMLELKKYIVSVY
jgi:hypothetical protein